MHAAFLKWSWNGLKPVAAFIMFIKSNWIFGKAFAHPNWSCSTVYQMHWMSVLLVHSLAPSVSGWWAKDIFSFTPVSLCKCFQKRARKSLSLSEIILSGRLFLQYQCVKNNSASCSAISVETVGISRMSEPRPSVMVRIMSKSPSFGKGPTKSIAMESQWPSGTGRGCRGPSGFEVWDLLHWQSAHPGMYPSFKSRLMCGQ